MKARWRRRDVCHLLLSAMGVGLNGVSAWSQTGQQHHHPPQSADEYASVLEDPGRDEWQKPHEVFMALRLKSSDTVADVGAGTGYFTRRLAMHAAKVFAVDIDAKLLEMTAKSSPSNVSTVLSVANDPLLPPNSVDLIFICDVLHHLTDRPAYYKRMVRALKDGGRIVVVEFRKDKLPIGPPPEMKLSDQTIAAEFQQAGFILHRSETFLPYQYFLEFVRQEANNHASGDSN